MYLNLFGATVAQNVERLQFFLDDPSVELKVSFGKSPILVIATTFADNLHIFTQILNCPRLDVNDTDCVGHTALSKAVEHNDRDKIKLLLQHPNIDITKNNPISFTNNQDILNLFYILYKNPIQAYFLDYIAPWFVYKPESVFTHGNDVNHEFSGLWK